MNILKWTAALLVAGMSLFRDLVIAGQVDPELIWAELHQIKTINYTDIVPNI